MLVVVSKVFFTPDWYEIEQSQRFTHWKDYRTPNLQVLRVCKQIYAEAMDVYFTKNLFLLPPDYNLTYPFQHVDKGDTSLQSHKGLRLFSTTGLQKIRNLSIGFSLGSRVPMVMSASSWALAEGATMREFSAMGAAERLALAHVHAKIKQARFWSVLTQALARKAYQAVIPRSRLHTRLLPPWMLPGVQHRLRVPAASQTEGPQSVGSLYGGASVGEDEDDARTEGWGHRRSGHRAGMGRWAGSVEGMEDISRGIERESTDDSGLGRSIGMFWSRALEEQALRSSLILSIDMHSTSNQHLARLLCLRNLHENNYNPAWG